MQKQFNEHGQPFSKKQKKACRSYQMRRRSGQRFDTSATDSTIEVNNGKSSENMSILGLLVPFLFRSKLRGRRR